MVVVLVVRDQRLVVTVDLVVVLLGIHLDRALLQEELVKEQQVKEMMEVILVVQPDLYMLLVAVWCWRCWYRWNWRRTSRSWWHWSSTSNHIPI